MKKFLIFNFQFSILILTLVLVACGTDSGHFRIEGHLLNLNQGEFYVYSTDGAINAIDTIHVQAGHFSYETTCTDKGTLVIIFPNFSEMPVFCEPGKTVSMKGDASHLKEVTIKGTDDNKLMSSFRELTLHSSPPEIARQVELFVGDNPESLVATYLVQKYILQQPVPDYRKASSLLKTLSKAQPENGYLKELQKQVQWLVSSSVNSKLPSFTASDVNGNTLTSESLSHCDAVIYTYASWDYEGMAIYRMLMHKQATKNSLRLLGICLDASPKQCREQLKRENINVPVICDGQMFEGSLVHKLGFTSTPQNIILHNGTITARNLTLEELTRKFN